MEFSRTKNVKKLMEAIKAEDLYTNLLKKDEEVFMALRENAIHFYCGGSRLFEYKNKKFLSHKKFCFNADINKDYIELERIKDIKPIADINKNYKQIKELAKLYAGLEGEGISYLYKYDYLSDNEIIILDVEIALYENEKKDRIDLLLFNTTTKELKFVEAKYFSNKELWAKKGSEPKVKNQIRRYEKTINKYQDLILDEYKKYIKIINEKFNKTLPLPQKIYDKVLLYMFGFDNDQKNKIKTLLKDDGSLEGVEYYFIGNPSKIKIQKLYESRGN